MWSLGSRGFFVCVVFSGLGLQVGIFLFVFVCGTLV